VVVVAGNGTGQFRMLKKGVVGKSVVPERAKWKREERLSSDTGI
jgi:hypothetical protein